MKIELRTRGGALAVFAGLLCSVSVARAGTGYHVTMPTDLLNTNAVTPYSLDFQFIDGGTPANNSVTLTDFMFGSGGAVGSPSALTGGASGDLSSGITLTDSSFFNEFTQTFTPGSQLSFDLNLTSNADVGSPDELSFYVLDGTNAAVPTSDAFASSLFTVDLNASGPAVATFVGQGAYAGMTPTFSPIGPAPVPEPAFYQLGTMLALGAVGYVRKRRKTTPTP